MEKINMAAVIKHNRIVMGLTQEELASNLYVTKATVSKWERGQGYPEISLIPKIANFFGISIDELFDFAPENGYACKVSYTGVILKEEIEDYSLFDYIQINELKLVKFVQHETKNVKTTRYEYPTWIEYSSQALDFSQILREKMKKGIYIELTQNFVSNGDTTSFRQYVCKQGIACFQVGDENGFKEACKKMKSYGYEIGD